MLTMMPMDNQDADAEALSLPEDVMRLARWAKRKEARGNCALGPLFVSMHRVRVFRLVIRGCLELLEGGHKFSRTWRDILERHHNVTVGMYTYGECLKPRLLPEGTQIGNYCSIANDFLVLRHNHPTDRISQHPFFSNKSFGLLDRDNIKGSTDNPLAIGHDVWIGARVIVLAKCRRIGDGAVIGAGSVVTRDVEPFTIVAGNPARVLRPRFPEDMANRIAESKWWLRPLSELVENLPAFVHPASLESVARLTARCAGERDARNNP